MGECCVGCYAKPVSGNGRLRWNHFRMGMVCLENEISKYRVC